ncbi:MAG: pyridoxal phosphate-dependent aminotransferase [Dehalococcoidales bacterium]|nr:pyridoxal phosphate-dependent aminotransferase [Dehalococcoidales bacterium]
MKYDFDRVYSRKNTGSAKWDAIKAIFGSEDVIPMWVADMDFPTAKPIVEALKKRAEHPFYGYTHAAPGVTEAVTDRLQRKFNWKVEPEWVVFTPGVIPALSMAVKALTHPGDEIILQEPVYFPFFSVVKANGCQVATNQLKLNNGRYEMDFTELDSKFESRGGMEFGGNRIKAIILCNPHNPIGRLWGKEDLTRLGKIMLKQEIPIISDEIHCELLYKGHKHTPFATLSREFERNSIVCMAPSKTFNLPGLHASSIIIPDKKLRDKFSEARAGSGYGMNIFGLTAMEAAYRYGDEWLEQLLVYLQGNLDFTLKYFKEKIPKIKVIKPQATYLLWLDCRGLGLDDPALSSFMKEKAKVGMNDGFIFGAGGSGFQRMNIACPRTILEEALQRIEKAVGML